MPKPTRRELLSAVTENGGVAPSDVSVDRLASLVSAAWVETERLRGALETYGEHDGLCERHNSRVGYAPRCTCGLDDALGYPSETRAAWSYAPDGEPAMSSTGEGEDWEEFNRLQRARRQGYASAVISFSAYNEKARELAAERFPLKKRVPKVIPDPHGQGEWRLRERPISDAGEAFYFRRPNSEKWDRVPSWWPWTAARVRALAALWSDPWKWVDDTSVEEDPA